MSSEALVRVQREDRFEFRLDGPKATRLPNGMIEAWGVATRVGIFEYLGEGGAPFREFRPAAEVLKPESLDSLRGVPFTIDHPTEDVTIDNSRALTHGWVIDVRGDAATGLVWVKVRVSSRDALEALGSGKVELSCGYSAILLAEQGSTDEGEYDAIQTSIVYNHLALVDAARAGPVARLRLDSCRVHRHDTKAHTMKFTLRHDGKSLNLPAYLVPGLKAAAAEVRVDMIETAKVTIEGPDGLAELVLPLEVVEEIVAMLGGKSKPAAAPAPADAEPEVPEPALPEEEGLDAAEGDKPEEKMDAKSVRKMIADAVKAEVPKAIAKAKADATAEATERSDVLSQARVVLGDSFAHEGKSTWKICGEAIEAAGGSQPSLVTKADSGDERSRGRLLSLLATAVSDRRKKQDQSADVVDLFRPKTDSEAAPELSGRDKMIQKKKDAIKGAK